MKTHLSCKINVAGPTKKLIKQFMNQGLFITGVAIFLGVNIAQVYSAEYCHQSPIKKNLYNTIAELQGHTLQSPYKGQLRQTSGIITSFLFKNNSAIGLFIQGHSPESRHAPKASTGIFIQLNQSKRIHQRLTQGQSILVTGQVKETYGLTQMVPTQPILVCNRTPIPLPEAIDLSKFEELVLNAKKLEGLEGQLIKLPSATIKELHHLLSYGSITASTPWLKNTVIIDDLDLGVFQPEQIQFNNGQHHHMLTAYLKRPLRAGDTLYDIEGILGYAYGHYRIHLTSPPKLSTHTKRPSPLNKDPNVLRIMGANLYNFFNGHLQSGKLSFASQKRGARSRKAFETHTNKIKALWQFIQPDIAVLSEIENDGQGPHSASQTLLNTLNQAHATTPNSPIWTMTSSHKQHQDHIIRNAIVYRQDRATALNPGWVLELPGTKVRHRSVHFQNFSAGSMHLTLGAVHLKSRGGCKNQKVCWNKERTAATEFIAKNVKRKLGASTQSTSKQPVLLMGDFNTTPGESALTPLKHAGFVSLLNASSAYSYRYKGKPLLIDHAFWLPGGYKTLPLAYTVSVSSDEAPFLNPTHRDHNKYLQTKKAFLQNLANQSNLKGQQRVSNVDDVFRFSDHDPVIVDIPLNHIDKKQH